MFIAFTCEGDKHLLNLSLIHISIRRQRQMCIRDRVEMNLIEQVGNVVKTSIVQKAWKQHKRPHVHGWVYEMETGLLRTVIDVEPGASIDPMYEFREE